MTERERHREPDPYWTDDVLLGEVPLPGGPALVRLRAHHAVERYHGRNVAELVPLAHPVGERGYVHARPYVLEPEITLTVGLFPTLREGGAVGEVVDSAWEGMRHVEIGQAQAWHYPADRLLVLWEGYLFDRWRSADPMHNPALAAVWRGFEEHLLARFPDTERIATPSWEDIYERPAWQAFLSQHGYAPATPGVFVKELRPGGAARETP
jgi:hypothetical protein